ncbi:MAG: sigma-70 family RNA polymerase sigma factor [Anaerolineales bacterium]|jgi:RNA polymerase sigma-70 factor (ECF subfamily)|nr:sigma-70 family RNA polymerase sigma factor [Anaerolineales bacterium]
MIKRTNEEWRNDLRAEGEQRDSALLDLREAILAGLPYALNRWLSTNDPRLASLAEEVTQEALLRVLDRLDTFEGRSQFLTWVQKIAVRIALTELRRKRWENVSLEELVEGEEGPPMKGLTRDHQASSPEDQVEATDMMLRLQRIISEELTDKQRQAMMAVAIQGMPLEEVARRMGTNRNALYKLMHDTRLRLKHRLAQEGLTPEDVLAVYERR